MKACVRCHGYGQSTADTIARCAENAVLEQCEPDDVCMIEARRKAGELIEVKTMCKGRESLSGLFGVQTLFNLNKILFQRNKLVIHSKPKTLSVDIGLQLNADQKMV